MKWEDPNSTPLANITNAFTAIRNEQAELPAVPVRKSAREFPPTEKAILNGLQAKIQAGHPVYNGTADPRAVAARRKKAKASRRARKRS